ncbi:MAG: hypothetical protein COB15_17150 [Flavobacteriales bacterium]|nr:MAG: hypothetical protein COB15_17150 [Flavobacteriales bacterium]
MNKEYRNITAEEVFFIFKEEHRICSHFDPEADPTVVLTMDSSIEDWRYSMDLLKWEKLSQYLNKEFEIQPNKEEWIEALCPAKEKTMRNVCELISHHARLEVIKPIKLFGKQCLSASLFRSIEKNLSNRGVDTSGLKPSSKIEPFLKSNFGEFIEQINKNFTGVIPEIKMGKTKLDKVDGYSWFLFMITLIASFFWNSIWYIPAVFLLIALTIGYFSNKEFNTKDGMMTIPEIETFRDLIERIIREKYTTQQHL